MSRCLSCGEIIPEGRQVCWKCEHTVGEEVQFLTPEAAMAYIKRCGTEKTFEVEHKDGMWHVRRKRNDD